MKRLILFGTVLAFAFALHGTEVDLTLKENWTIANVDKNAKSEFTKEADGTLSLKTNSSNFYLTRNLTFQKGKALRIEGKIEANCFYYIKLYFINEKGKLISEKDFHIIPGTATSLVEGVSGTERIIKITNGAKWTQGKPIAVKTADSKLLSMNNKLKEIRSKNGFWEIELNQPIGKEFQKGATFVQTFSNDGKLLANLYSFPIKPLNLSWTLEGDFATEAGENGKWWPGAKIASLQLIMHGKVADKTLKISKMKITTIDSATEW